MLEAALSTSPVVNRLLVGARMRPQKHVSRAPPRRRNIPVWALCIQFQTIGEMNPLQPGSNDLHFPTKFSQSFIVQCKACFWKQHWSYWRDAQYNAVRLFMTVVVGLVFGLIFWDKGQKMAKQQDLTNLMGAMYAAVLFLGGSNASSVQSVVSIERTVFYREKAAGMYSELPYAFAQG